MKIKLVVLLMLAVFQVCKAQTHLPIIENYNKGELEIKVQDFSYEKPLSIGKITVDGTIHFNFPELDLNAMDKMEDTYAFNMQKIGRAVGMFVCHDKDISENTEIASVVKVNYFHLYKYGRQVGFLLPETEEETRKNKFVIGSSTLSWFYSSGKGTFKATCKIYEEDGLGNGGLDKNNLRNKTSYNINFKKGWNIVETKLLETKELEDDRGKYTRRLIETKTSLVKMPNTINWQLKYTANDELLEIEQQLITKTPITKKQCENWAPKKLGNLKRTSYEIGKTLARMPTLNNIELLFEKGSKKATVTIVDCANSKEAASIYTLMIDMASRDWKDKTDTGYKSASKIDNTRVMIDYNEKQAKTILSYNALGRFIIKAESINISPETLWVYLKTLNLEALVN